ncbi:GNAT family N-acetyltransferase [Proteinivorax hydrogeniformans]|uniref:GNAT family N-acetyltransferase n=1 Tax=Proteinivorax hydrogeniformans TaxID=1826727 RepID=A0AAU8HRS7_9FIRM
MSLMLENLSLKPITEDNLDDLLSLQNEIVKQINSDEMFEPETKDGLLPLIENDKIYILGCYTDQTLIAYGTLLFPKFDKENLGYDLEFAKEELPFVAHVDSIAVHPKYRGLGLQTFIGNYLGSIAKNQGFKHLMSTVSPDNFHSINNVFKQGYKIKKLTSKYGGKKRYIFYKEVK